MGKYSREKGKRGERLFCSLCRENGYDVHRTAQYRGNTGDAGDVEGLPGIHVECKLQERLNLYDAMAQSVHDADASGNGEIPIVAHKRSRCDWLITMRAEDWFRLYREYNA